MTKASPGALSPWAEAVGAAALAEAIVALHDDDVFFVVDADRVVRHWSSGAEELLGYSAAEAVGSHCLKTKKIVTIFRKVDS